QHAALLLVGAEYDHRVEPENVHVHRRRTRHAGTRLGDRAHHDGGFGDAEPGSAKSLRHGNAEPAVGRKRHMELVRKAALAVALEPIVLGKARADFLDCVAHRLLLGCQLEVDRRCSWVSLPAKVGNPVSTVATKKARPTFTGCPPSRA